MISSHTLEKIIKHNCWVDCETSKITFLDSPSVFNIEPFVQLKKGIMELVRLHILFLMAVIYI